MRVSRVKFGHMRHREAEWDIGVAWNKRNESVLVRNFVEICLEHSSRLSKPACRSRSTSTHAIRLWQGQDAFGRGDYLFLFDAALRTAAARTAATRSGSIGLPTWSS